MLVARFQLPCSGQQCLGLVLSEALGPQPRRLRQFDGDIGGRVFLAATISDSPVEHIFQGGQIAVLDGLGRGNLAGLGEGVESL